MARIGKPKKLSIENLWESFLWGTRFLVIIAIIAGLVGSLMLFVLGAWEIGEGVQVFIAMIGGSHDDLAGTHILSAVIGSIDTFLIAVVVLLFCFGIYELFISDIEPAKGSETEGILHIPNLEALKDKIASVIIMALVVKFFQIVLTIQVQSITEIMLYAASVALLSLAILLLQTGQRILAKLKEKPTTEPLANDS